MVILSAKKVIAALLIIILAVGLAMATAGCLARPAQVGNDGPAGQGDDQGGQGGTTRVTAPTLAEIQKEFHPNELGRVLILEYHQIGDHEERWERSSENFRKDLETLYAQGYRLVNLRDYLAGKIDLPAGLSPVILTFDDGDGGQFRYILKDGQPVIDPNSAVGILMAFHAKHPDFGLAGTFYVLWPSPFGQKDYARQKISFLINNGFEVGNHTASHDKLSGLTPDQVQKELALPNKYVAEVVPGYALDSLALPYGISPADPELLKKGSYEGTSYELKAVLLVGAQPALSPFDKDLNPYRLPRVQAIPSELDKWLSNLKDPLRRYISDGRPDVVSAPKSLEGKASRGLAQSGKLSLYETTGP
ncbi:MAG: polysaccharide deacetylase family protein [Bacillota bacterium]